MTESLFSPLPLANVDASFGAWKNTPKFGSALPVSGNDDETKRWFPPLVVIPSVPSSQHAPVETFATPWATPIAAMPAAIPAESEQPKHYTKPEFIPEILPEIELPEESRLNPVPDFKAVEESPSSSRAVPDFTDADLAEALSSMMGTAARSDVPERERAHIADMLEPMLRATVRRALAEYSPASRPFQSPGFLDRIVWRMQALFSSRTFEDILFEKTHRFQIDEVYLLDGDSLALVSFASCDPARHSTFKRVENSAKRIAAQIRDENGQIQCSFEKPDGRNVISEVGEQVILVAIVRGQPNEMILADLEFSLRRIEDHFHDQFEQAGTALMHALQPFLEDCLLIQAPASAA